MYSTKCRFSLITYLNIYFTYLIVFNIVLARSAVERTAYGESHFMWPICGDEMGQVHNVPGPPLRP